MNQEPRWRGVATAQRSGERAMAKERHESAFIFGALAGGVAGAVWGLLNAPAATGPQPGGFGPVLERAADRLIVAAADFEIMARAWLRKDDAGDVYRGFPESSSPLWAEAPPQVDIVIDGPRPIDGPGAAGA
jgi:hypothetical protein